ncbi:MAG TPA: putative holin-like toxin [Mobilitalea sp.]|nr:putative holin-like toxin [Mobilitalea sp.]
MRTYEAISLMLTFGLLLIALITYLDRHNKPKK